jgi:hypothetical protein
VCASLTAKATAQNILWDCVLSAQKLGTTPKTMREVFGRMPRCRIALETWMRRPWISRLLTEFGDEVIVAHARNVRLIREGRKKDDRTDRGEYASSPLDNLQRYCTELPQKHAGCDCAWLALPLLTYRTSSSILSSPNTGFLGASLPLKGSQV